MQIIALCLIGVALSFMGLWITLREPKATGDEKAPNPVAPSPPPAPDPPAAPENPLRNRLRDAILEEMKNPTDRLMGPWADAYFPDEVPICGYCGTSRTSRCGGCMYCRP